MSATDADPAPAPAQTAPSAPSSSAVAASPSPPPSLPSPPSPPPGLFRRAAVDLRHRLAAARPSSILVAAFAVMLVYAFPGHMTLDSIDHLREARLGFYTDSHPPVIALLFKLCDTLVAGPICMLLLQNALLLGGVYSILARLLLPRRAAWIAAALFVSPQVLPVMATIWKDCFMAGFLAAGIAGLLSQHRSRRLLALLSLSAATAMRYNAFGATLPLIVLLFEWRPGQRWLVRYATAFALWIAVTFAAFAANSALTDRQMHFWHSSIAIFDLVGTYATLDQDLTDAQLREDLRGTGLLVDRDLHATIRRLYSPRTFFPILQDPATPLWSLPIDGVIPAPQAQRDAISRAFWHVVTTYPVAYLHHRLAATAATLDLESRRDGYINRRAPAHLAAAAELGYSTHVSFIQSRFTRAYFWIASNTPLLVPWLYLVLSLILLPLARRQRDVLAILLSGLIMESSLLFLAHTTDYRYSHWMVISTILAAIYLAVRRRRTRRATLSAPAPRSSPQERAA